MIRLLICLLPLLFCGADWITAPSYYTHRDGVRVQQYEPIPAPVVTSTRPQGGWTRSIIRGPDGSMDVYWSGVPWYGPRYITVPWWSRILRVD